MTQAIYYNTKGEKIVLKNYEVDIYGNVLRNGTLHICRKSGDGYFYILRYPLHRIIGSTFIPCPNYQLVIDHIDYTDKLNNSVNNLQWTSVIFNCSKANLGKKRNPEQLKNMSNAQKGRIMSDETKLKMSISQKERWRLRPRNISSN